MAEITKVRVAGIRVKSALKIEGEYVRRKEEMNSRPTYKKEYQGDEFVIWSNTMKKNTLWMISKAEHVGTDSAYACARDPAMNPSEIQSYWMVFDKTQGNYKKVKTVVIEAVYTEVGEALYQDYSDDDAFVPPEPPAQEEDAANSSEKKRRGSVEIEEKKDKVDISPTEEFEALQKELGDLNLEEYVDLEDTNIDDIDLDKLLDF